MSIYRNEIGHLHHTKNTRDFRRAHMQGAMRLVLFGGRATESFGTRIKNALQRLLGRD